MFILAQGRYGFYRSTEEGNRSQKQSPNNIDGKRDKDE